MSPEYRHLLDELEKWGAEPAQTLEETFMNDTDFYLECLNKFAHEDFLDTLRRTLSPEQKAEAIRAVHTMKGNADYLGLFPVMDAALTMLADLRADKLEQAAARLPELEAAFAAFTLIMKQNPD